MNAESYLRKQGWKGSGHSLDSTGRGIKKPLLISHKQDQLGLGKKKAAWTTDDQWWMRAYDQSLQNIGTGEESTLNQIRTKGINRGGLYGFFVKGEAIAGTMDDSSASATEASIPASGASTPPTSASETEAPAKAVKKSDKKSKRRRQDNDVVATVKKAEKAEAKGDKGQERSSTKDQKTVARKLAKLSPKKRALYKERAAAKKQTINEYILRRISKKSAKRANRYAEAAPQNLFFTDVSGDTTLPYHQTTVTPSRPILGLAQESLEDAAPGVTSLGKPDFAAKKKPTEKPTKKLPPSAEYRAKKAGGGKNADREKRKLKKAD